MKSNWIFAILFISLIACGRDQAEERVVEEELREVPEFNADSAYSFIQRQVDFGPRVPNTEAHQETKRWLVEKFNEYGMQVTEQDFEAKAYDGTNLKLTNIFAAHNPQASKRILLAAHWDTRHLADKDTENIEQPIDGANDGGSGVGVILEIARVIATSGMDPEVGVDFILFDGEDYGEPEQTKPSDRNHSQIWWALGSQHWSRNPHEAGYSAYYGILLDMVGAKGARFYREGYSMQYARNIVQKVWRNAHRLGHGDFFPMRDSHEIIDDHVFVNQVAKIPMIDIVEYSPDYGFGKYHHTHQDSMDLIDRRTLKAVGETVLFTIYQE
ncbi:M28 family peptidase [Litoribacter ruber]|uniref:M28 family peptidase n=1 Tax=Litoribacter ruber TaxID=702568 RepID=UPI001BDB02B3|nr:M28 family peptidase [Litoribacter ruber]MBT0810022.1 M28 family peptidase [Litoribacter ruber]